jgi:hypothetical protein
MARRSKLNVENKTRIYKTIIRPIITYAAPVWCGVSDTALHCLQTLQNKCLKLATNSSPYTKISNLHNETETEMLREHLEKLSYNFYKYRLQHSRFNPKPNKNKKTQRPSTHKTQATIHEAQNIRGAGIRKTHKFATK